MRKTFTLFIALMALTASSWAQTEVQIGDFWYQLGTQGNFKFANVMKLPETGTLESYGNSVSGDIVIPATVTYNTEVYEVMGLLDYAFVGCSDITSVTIEEGVLDINPHAFDGCTGLTTVTLPSTIMDLGNQAFTHTGLTTITIKATTPPTYGSSLFSDSESLVHIYVPAASVAAYKAAEGWSAHASIIDEIPAGPASSVTWNESQVNNIYLAPYDLNVPQRAPAIDGITASVTKTSDGTCQFTEKEIWMQNNGNVTFTSAVGDITGIVITCSTVYGTYLSIVEYLPAGWTYDSEAETFTWDGTPSSAVSISGNIDFKITSIEFTLDNAAPAPAELTTTWEARQVSHVRFDGYNEDDLRSSGVIKNIIASHERTDAGYCSFQDGQLWIENNGYVKFKSIAGNLTGIVIRCSDLGSPSNLSDGWTSQALAKTLTWTGDAEEVTLSGNIGCTISSIEFTYTPAAAPHVGEPFEQAYQLYEITGAHTAKVPAQSFGGSFYIPEYVDYDEVRYYITEIDDYAFYNQDDLSDITGGVNIARIGAHACEGCTHMRSFSLDGGVLDEIGVDAFKNCKLLAYYESNTTTPPVLGNNVFAGDELLNHILIDYNGVDAYKEADGWSAYESIIDYRGIDASVGEKFFDLVQMYTGLYEVTTPATYGTPGEAKVVPYTSYINDIYPITRTGTLVIPEDANYMGSEYAITGIGENAYKDSTRFNAVMIPQQVTSIEAGAFLNCTGVENVYFLWENPNTITWYDRDKGLEFATATSGKTKIYVPKGKLAAYQSWAPSWASCMYDVELFDVDVTQAEDPDHSGRFYRTFFDSENDYLLPPSVWAHVGYVENNEFILRSIAYDGQILPKNTAVVLESETPIYHLIKSEGSAPAYTGQNDLRGTDVNLAVSSLPAAQQDKVYVLGKEAWIGGNRQVGMGMYRYTGEYLGAHKAYMIVGGTSGAPTRARFLFRHEDETTDTENVQENNATYTKILRNGQLIILKDGKEYNAMGQIVK